METMKRSFVLRALIDQRGQMLPLAVLGMVALVGLGGLSVDIGRAYAVRTSIQTAANAAALAGATQVYVGGSTVSAASTEVAAAANAYSASTGGLNYSNFNGTVTTTVSTPCITALYTGNVTCANTSNTPNAVRVTETATIPTFFLVIATVKTLTVHATATSTIAGVPPYNIAIVLDGTPSMVNTDPNCAGLTAEQCSLNGIQTMLKLLKPCAPGAVPASGTTAPCPDATSAMARVRVSMFSFPNLATTGTGSVANDYNGFPNCTGAPTAYPYTLPNIPPIPPNTGYDAGYTPVTYSGANATNGNPNQGHYKASFTGTYQITPPGVGGADANGFQSDFYDPTQPNSLNVNSTLVKAVGNGVNAGCLVPPTGLTDASGYSGGGETYLAGAIYAAQAALQAEKKAAYAILGVSTKSALIVVSDGQMNTNKGMFPVGDGYTTVSSNGHLTMTSNGTYPSYIDACQQAMIAGQYAKSAGIDVYGVAYGAESGGCTPSSGVDSTVVSPLPSYVNYNYSFSSTGQILPCVTMENIASSTSNFYEEVSSVDCSLVTTSNAGMDHLGSIFSSITASMSPKTYLIPNTLN